MAALKSDFDCIEEWLWQHWTVTLTVLRSGYGSTEQRLTIEEWLWQQW